VAWYAYGYFVWTPNGVVHSGHDFGPTLDTYKVGDSLGVRSGVDRNRHRDIERRSRKEKRRI